MIGTMLRGSALWISCASAANLKNAIQARCLSGCLAKAIFAGLDRALHGVSQRFVHDFGLQAPSPSKPPASSYASPSAAAEPSGEEKAMKDKARQ